MVRCFKITEFVSNCTEFHVRVADTSAWMMMLVSTPQFIAVTTLRPKRKWGGTISGNEWKCECLLICTFNKPFSSQLPESWSNFSTIWAHRHCRVWPSFFFFHVSILLTFDLFFDFYTIRFGRIAQKYFCWEFRTWLNKVETTLPKITSELQVEGVLSVFVGSACLYGAATL